MNTNQLIIHQIIQNEKCVKKGYKSQRIKKYKILEEILGDPKTLDLSYLYVRNVLK